MDAATQVVDEFEQSPNPAAGATGPLPVTTQRSPEVAGGSLSRRYLPE